MISSVTFPTCNPRCRENASTSIWGSIELLGLDDHRKVPALTHPDRQPFSNHPSGHDWSMSHSVGAEVLCDIYKIASGLQNDMQAQ